MRSIPLTLAAMLLVVACGARTPIEGYPAPQDPPATQSPTSSPVASAPSPFPSGPTPAPTPATEDAATSPVTPPADAGPAVDPSTLPPYSTAQCFGAVTSDPNVTCNASGGPSGDACNTVLDCEGHMLLMNCADGVCTCLNPDYGDTCYCLAPSTDTCDAMSNCCWS